MHETTVDTSANIAVLGTSASLARGCSDGVISQSGFTSMGALKSLLPQRRNSVQLLTVPQIKIGSGQPSSPQSGFRLENLRRSTSGDNSPSTANSDSMGPPESSMESSVSIPTSPSISRSRILEKSPVKGETEGPSEYWKKYLGLDQVTATPEDPFPEVSKDLSKVTNYISAAGKFFLPDGAVDYIQKNCVKFPDWTKQEVRSAELDQIDQLVTTINSPLLNRYRDRLRTLVTLSVRHEYLERLKERSIETKLQGALCGLMPSFVAICGRKYYLASKVWMTRNITFSTKFWRALYIWIFEGYSRDENDPIGEKRLRGMLKSRFFPDIEKTATFINPINAEVDRLAPPKIREYVLVAISMQMQKYCEAQIEEKQLRAKTQGDGLSLRAIRQPSSVRIELDTNTCPPAS